MTMDSTQQSSHLSFCRPEPSGTHIPTDAHHTDVTHEIDRIRHQRHNVLGEVPALPRLDVVNVAVVDRFAFTRDCLMEALASGSYGIALRPFGTLAEFQSSDACDVDVILYYDHDDVRFDVLATSDDPGTRYLTGIPMIVLSDSATALSPQTIRAALKAGVRGFMSARTIEMRTVSAAVRFVQAGGTFAPVDLLLADEAEHSAARDELTSPPGLLTPRQTSVLSQMQQGKANKIIAYELTMSESTVKVHIRNIMRKMGATNRTQALYKFQQISRDWVGPNSGRT